MCFGVLLANYDLHYGWFGVKKKTECFYDECLESMRALYKQQSKYVDGFRFQGNRWLDSQLYKCIQPETEE